MQANPKIRCSRLCVLIVSNNTTQREQLLLRGLRERGFAADGLGSAADLYQRLSQKIYDLILIDSILPDENGYSVAARLRCVKRVGVEMLSTLFYLFGENNEGHIDLDRAAEYLRAIAAQAETLSDPAPVSWRCPDTTAQASHDPASSDAVPRDLA